MDAKTIADAQNFLRAFRSAMAFAEAASQLGNVQGELSALKQSYEMMSIDIEKQRAMLAKLQDEKAAALRDIEVAKGEAKEILRVSREKATNALAVKMQAAELESAALLKKARDEAAEWDYRTKLVRDEHEAKKAELAEVEKKLASTKEAIQKLAMGLNSDGRL